MALIQTGGGIAVISGKIGGTVYFRGPGGASARAWVKPIDPGSARQQLVRFAVAQLTTRWGEILTDLQRAAWATYAENVPLPNRMGSVRPIGALPMYVRCNVPRITGLDPITGIQDDAPAIFDIGTYTAPAVDAIDAASNTMTWSFGDTDDWAITEGGAMYVFASKPKNPTIHFYKGPYNAAATIPGAVIPPSSPVQINLPFPVEVGQKIFIRANVTHSDGRLASSFRTFGFGE